MSAVLTFPRRVLIALLATAVAFVGAALPARAAAGDVTEFALAASSAPFGLTLGPDGNIWVANGGGGNAISKVAPDGTTTNYPMLTAGANPRFIAVGSDNNLWFTMQSANKIGRITTAGVITEFAVPTPNAEPWGITPGPDGNLWFTELRGNKIGRITTAGVITEFAIPTANSEPWGIAAAPKGAAVMYFTEQAGNKVGSITMSGAITEVTLAAGSAPQGIAVIGDQVWFAESGTNKIARLVGTTPLEISMPGGSQPTWIAEGPGQSMWVSLNRTSQLVLLTSAGAISATYAVGSATNPVGVDMGSDANMWVAESLTGKVARVLTGQTPMIGTAPAITPTTAATGATLTATTGTWLYNATSYAYTWQRCTSAAATSCTNVGAATTYAVQAADAGQFLRVLVAATNLNGAAQGVSSNVVQVSGGTTPTPSPTPTPTPTPSASAAATVTVIDAPVKQKRGKAKAYTLTVSNNAPGTVVVTFTKKNRVSRLVGIQVAGQPVTVSWKAPKKWPTGKTLVTAVFTPTNPAAFTTSTGTDKVKIIK